MHVDSKLTFEFGWRSETVDRRQVEHEQFGKDYQ
jgi:hypothetical protein